jgi:hypothetical protein
MDLPTAKMSGKLGWNSRVCRRIRIIDYIGINNSRDQAPTEGWSGSEKNKEKG